MNGGSGILGILGGGSGGGGGRAIGGGSGGGGGRAIGGGSGGGGGRTIVQKPARTGYRDALGIYHPGPSYVGFDEHADACAPCDLLRAVAPHDYIDRRKAREPSWARDVPTPIGRHLECGGGTELPARRFVRLPPVRMPVPLDPCCPRLGRWQRLCAWFRYQPAAWPSARLVQR